MNGQTQEAAVDQSRMQQLVALLEKSVEAHGKAGPYTPYGAEKRLYSYMDYIEKRIEKEMPGEAGSSVICDAWNSLDWEHDEDLLPLPAEDQVPVEDIPNLVRLANPRLPEKLATELGRRVQATYAARAEARPFYDEVLEFLGLTWAFQYRKPGCCADPVDKAFLDSVDSGDAEPYDEIIGGYEDTFETVDDSIVAGPVTTEEAERLIALAEEVNAARAEYRAQATAAPS
jgi:hypothetical protein